jgi:hypothetical protein
MFDQCTTTRKRRADAPTLPILALVVAGVAFATPTWAAPPPKKTDSLIRSYYLTPGLYDGSQASTACAAGYHMASIFEIYGTWSLRYASELAGTFRIEADGQIYEFDDTGAGPPANIPTLWAGWIRSSFINDPQWNCEGWTDSSVDNIGAVATPMLPSQTNDLWHVSGGSCSVSRPVWCVQD